MSPYLPETKEKDTTFKTISVATPILCCGKSGATCCQLKRDAIKNTTNQLRNVDLCVAPTQQVAPRAPVPTAQFALRIAKSATSLSRSRRRWRRRRRAVQCQELLWARLSLSRRAEWGRNGACDKDAGGWDRNRDECRVERNRIDWNSCWIEQSSVEQNRRGRMAYNRPFVSSVGITSFRSTKYKIQNKKESAGCHQYLAACSSPLHCSVHQSLSLAHFPNKTAPFTPHLT